jgi:hypothetical protein
VNRKPIRRRAGPLRHNHDDHLSHLSQAPIILRREHAELLERHDGGLIVDKPDGRAGEWRVTAVFLDGLLPNNIVEWGRYPEGAARVLLEILTESEVVFLRSVLALFRTRARKTREARLALLRG